MSLIWRSWDWSALSRAASPFCSWFFHHKSNHRQLPRSCLFVFHTNRWWDRTLQRARRNWILTRQFHMLKMKIMFGFSMLNTIESQCMSMYEHQFSHEFLSIASFSLRTLQKSASWCHELPIDFHISLISAHDTRFLWCECEQTCLCVKMHGYMFVCFDDKHTLKITKEVTKIDNSTSGRSWLFCERYHMIVSLG